MKYVARYLSKISCMSIINFKTVAMEAQIRSQCSPCGIYGGQSDIRASSSPLLSFFRVSVIPAILRALVSFISFRLYIILAIDSVVN
jgi:hypothetical protein